MAGVVRGMEGAMKAMDLEKVRLELFISLVSSPHTSFPAGSMIFFFHPPH